MKNNILKNTIIAGTLCTILVVPSFAQDGMVRPVSAKDEVIVPISYKFDHWSREYIDQLSKDYSVDSVFKNKDLNSSITVEDFQNLIKLVIDKDYNKAPDAITREVIVHEMTQLWAEKTGQDLNEIATIKMIIYPDTHEIDAKYNHSVTVAYMHKIAKGRDNGYFDPKANVTYGEAATLVTNLKNVIESETKPEVEPITKGKFETKGSYEIKDSKVVLDFELMSHHTKEKELQFGSGQQFEVVITDEEDQEVYRYSDDKFFTLALVYKNMKPGESLKWQDTWDMTNKEGEKLTSGKYKAEITIMALDNEETETIENDQLTTIIDFNL